MFHSISKMLEKVGSFIGEHPFSCGFFAGLAVVFVFMLLLFLVSLAFRPRKLRCIVIPSEGGELRIDAKAVQGAVLSVAGGFPAFDVRKVALYGKQTAVELLIAMDFNGGASLSELSVQFRTAVARMMSDVLGMEKPAQIELEILRSYADIPETGTGVDSAGSSVSESGQSC